MMSERVSKIVNLALYQLGWFSCIMGAARGFPLAGAAGAMVLTGVHLLLTDRRTFDLRLMLSAGIIGILVDSAQQGAGLFTFKTDPHWPLWLPLWVVVVWVQFASLFGFALSWLSGRYFLGAMLGFVGGPLAYWGGIRIGAASFGPSPWLALGTLAVVWALVMIVLLRINDRPGSRPGRYQAVFKGQL